MSRQSRPRTRWALVAATGSPDQALEASCGRGRAPSCQGWAGDAVSHGQCSRQRLGRGLPRTALPE